MNPVIEKLLREQQAVQFADLAGAQAALAVPISDRLISRAAAERAASSAAIKDVSVTADEGNQLTVQVRLAGAGAFLPPLRIRLVIERQPELPASPVIELHMLSEGVAALAGSVSRFVEFLPPGVTLAGDRVTINLETLLRQYGAAEILPFLTDVKVSTVPGRLIVAASLRVPVRA